MAGMICTVKGCGYSSNDARPPQCAMTQCPGRQTFKPAARPLAAVLGDPLPYCEDWFSIDKRRGWKTRPCPKCGLVRTAKGHDPCISELPGVIHACCGHGQHLGYIAFENGVLIRGEFEETKLSPPIICSARETTMTRDSFDRFQAPERGRFGDNELAPDRVTKTRLADVTVGVHHATEKALLVSLDGMEATAVWLPKARVEIEHKFGRMNGRRKDGRSVLLATAELTMPMALAQEKGLV